MGYFGEGQELTFNEPVFGKKGKDFDEVVSDLEEIDQLDFNDINGHVVFYATTLMSSQPASKISKLANSMFLKKNMLFREIASGLQKIDQETKQMIREMLGLSNEVRINFTSGGSESIYCGINAAYHWAKENKPKMRNPEIVVPYSMHAAVSKWCHYADIKIKRIPLGANLRADVKAMEEAVTDDTFFIAGSAPCWPYGLYDPIKDIAAIAKEYKLWMHVDACVGAYQAAFIEKVTGKPFPAWRIEENPNICSMSADVHKHAYSAKPLSTVFFKNKELQEYHWIHPADWPDGPYSTEAMQGSVTGGALASAWAVMKLLGEEGYMDLARKTLSARERYYNGINSIEGLSAWNSELSIMLIDTEDDLDAFSIMSGLYERNIAVLPTYQPKLLIKFALDPVTEEVIDNFLKNLEEVVKGVRNGNITSDFLMQYL